MEKFKKLNRSEMRNIIGGNMPLEDGDCSKDCICSDGSHVTAKLTGCEKDTCTTDADGAYCTQGGAYAGKTCVNVCPVIS
ncbi:MAG TPA: hypothetical protein VHA56_21990 [Mucilaginibacter sp.]|nr:hypothetical protein [Mucilaginibacter sp.]